MKIPQNVSVTDVMELRVIETSDGKAHACFQRQGTDEEVTKEYFCEETDYDVADLTVTDRTV